MKLNKVIILFISILCIASACNRNNDEPKPLTEIEKVSRTWQVSKVLINGQEDISGAFSSFSITFNSVDGLETTYTVTPGNAIDTPNLTSTNEGVWSLIANNTQIILDAGTDNEIILQIEATISEDSLVISWTVPKSIDKTQPRYQLELIPR